MWSTAIALLSGYGGASWSSIRHVGSSYLKRMLVVRCPHPSRAGNVEDHAVWSTIFYFEIAMSCCLRHGHIYLGAFVGVGRFQTCLGRFQILHLEPEMVQPDEVDPFRLVSSLIVLEFENRHIDRAVGEVIALGQRTIHFPHFL